MIRLSLRRRFLLGLVYLFGFLISFVTPLVYLGFLIKENIEFVNVDKVLVSSIFGILIILLLILFVYIKYIRRLFHRKLQAMAVVDEIGMYSAKSPVWNRIIKTIEYFYPFTLTLLFFFLMKTLFIQYPIFGKLYTMNILLLIVLGVGSVIFLIADLIKISMMNKQKVEDTLSSEIKKDKLYLRRLKKQKRTELAALEIQRELEALKRE